MVSVLVLKKDLLFFLSSHSFRTQTSIPPTNCQVWVECSRETEALVPLVSIFSPWARQTPSSSLNKAFSSCPSRLQSQPKIPTGLAQVLLPTTAHAHTDCNQFWELPASTEDVFSLFSPVDVRRARDSSLKNLETLISALISRLSVLRHNTSFPDVELAPEKHALNCIRVLTRILPFLYEADHLEAWEDKFFWTPRKKRSKQEQITRTDVLFDESCPEDAPEPETKESFETVKPLGEELIDNLIDLLFYTEFTLPQNERSRKKVTYSIWQSGVGCNTPMSSSKELESNRTEILRLLLTLSSKSLYMPARTFSSGCIYFWKLMRVDVLSVKGVKAITYIATYPDKQVVLSLLCSQLNTVSFSLYNLCVF